MVEIVFLIPLLTGIIAFFGSPRMGRSLLVITGLVHLALSVLLWIQRPEAMFPMYFGVTP